MNVGLPRASGSGLSTELGDSSAQYGDICEDIGIAVCSSANRGSDEAWRLAAVTRLWTTGVTPASRRLRLHSSCILPSGSDQYD